MKCVILLLSAVLFVIVEGGPLPKTVHHFEKEIPGKIKKHVEKGPEKIKKIAGEGGDGGGEVVEGGSGGGGADGAAKEIEKGDGPKLKKHVHHYKIPGEVKKHKIEKGDGPKLKKHVHHYKIPGKVKKHVHKFKKGAVGGGAAGGGGGGGGKRELGAADGGPPADGGNEGQGPKGKGPKHGHEDKVTKDRGKNSRPGKGCQEGLLTGTARELDSTIKGLTSGIANLLGANNAKAGLINNIINGAEAILDDTAGGLDQAVSDFFCGFNRVFNDIGTDLGHGKLLKAIGSGAITFATGAGSFFGNLGFNVISAVVSGASKLINGPKKG